METIYPPTITADMDDYHAQRKQLIADDRALRIDHAAQREISEEERRADKILRHIRSSEAVSVWSATQPWKHLHGSQQLFPGMEFLTGKHRGWIKISRICDDILGSSQRDHRRHQAF